MLKELKKIIIITGATCSGKDSLVLKLKDNKYTKKWKHLLSYTTRPKRDNEFDGQSYYFIDEKTLKNKYNEENSIIESFKAYLDKDNPDITKEYFYALPIEDVQAEVNYTILDAKRALQFKQKFGHLFDIIVVKLDVDVNTLYKRAIRRYGRNNLKEFERRYPSDFDALELINPDITLDNSVTNTLDTLSGKLISTIDNLPTKITIDLKESA